MVPSRCRQPTGCTLVMYTGRRLRQSLPPAMVMPRESRGSFLRLTVFSWLEKPLGGSCIDVQISQTNKQTDQAETKTIALAFLIPLT